MKHIIWMLAILLCSCGDNESCLDDGKYNNKVQVGMAIEFAIKIEGGLIAVEEVSDSFSVFTYTFDHPQCDIIDDDERTDIVSFQIPAGVNSFSFEGSSDLQGAKAYFRQAGAWASGVIYILSEGQISGEKKDNGIWDVDIDISFENQRDATKSIDYSGIFMIQ